MDTFGNTVVEIAEKVTEFAREALGIAHDVDVTGKIFLTGAKGVIGYRTALRLLNSGYPSVRIGARHPNDLEELAKKGAEIADFTWGDETTYVNALKGVKTVFCVAPYTDHWATSFPAFLRACEKAGVQYFVKVSFYHARKLWEPYQNVHLIKLHGKCDQLLGQSSLPCTILSASHFMSNALVLHHGELLEEDKTVILYGSSGGKNVNYVSPNDVAEVATRVLFDPKSHMGKEYTLTGLKPISDDYMASIMSKYAKKEVVYEDVPIENFEDKERASGGAHWKVRDLVGLEKIKASGLEEDVTFVSHDIQKICGRDPETFDDYLQATSFMTPMEKFFKTE